MTPATNNREVETNMNEDIEKSEQAAKDLSSRTRQLSDEYLAIEEQLVELEVRSGYEVAAAGDSGSARGFGKKIAELRETGTVISNAILAVRVEHGAAITRHARSLATRPRSQAAEMRQRASELDEKAAPHLAELREIQGVVYEPEMLPAAQQLVAPGGGVRAPLMMRRFTKAERLRADAAALERTAQELERAADRVPMHGEVEGASLEELVDAIFADPFRIGPAIPTVASWVKTATAAARTRLAEWHRRQPNAAEEIEAERSRFKLGRLAHINRLFPEESEERTRELQQMEVIAKQLAPDMPASQDAPLTYKLVWNASGIDEKTSRAIANVSGGVPQLEPVEVIGGGRR